MKVLIVYYSFTHNTKKTSLVLLEFLKEKGHQIDLVELKPQKEAKKFIHQALGAFTKTGGALSDDVNCDFSGYEAIFIASPVWAFSPAPIISEYISKTQNVKAKNIYLIVTYGSGLGKNRALDIMESALVKKGGVI